MVDIPSEDDLRSDGKICAPTDTPVAKKGPLKNPNKLMATAPATMFGTNQNSSSRPRHSKAYTKTMRLSPNLLVGSASKSLPKNKPPAKPVWT